MKKTVLNIIIIFLLSIPALSEDFVVIVNKNNPAHTIKKAMLKRLFTGRVKELEGAVAVPINQDLNSPQASKFLEEVIGQTPEIYKEYWVAQQIKGAGSAPMVQNGDEAIIKMVSAIPGAIGYISASSVTDAVKVLKIE